MSDFLRTDNLSVLVGDQRKDQLVLLQDINGDGTSASPGETNVFFDAGNASGLEAPTQSITGVFQAGDGMVYFGDAETDNVVKLYDLNGDRDAQDPREASLWFGEANAEALPVKAPNGIHQDAGGAIYISYAGLGSVYRTADLNGDGDAMDAGEATVWFDFHSVGLNGIPFSFNFHGDTAFISNLTDPTVGSLLRIKDADQDGTITQGEVDPFVSTWPDTSSDANIVAVTADQSSLICLTWYPARGNELKLHRLQDLDGSGKVDASGEITEIWTTKNLPVDAVADVGFSLTTNSNGDVLLAANGFSGDASVLRLVDADGDNAFFGATETIVFGSSTYDSQLLRPRALEYYQAGEPLIAHVDVSPFYGGGEDVLGLIVSVSAVALVRALCVHST